METVSSLKVDRENLTMSTIKPSETTEHPERLGASLFDLLYLDVYIPTIFFYKPEKGDGSTFTQRVSHIKESLSKLLVPYYPFAGRWVRTYDSRIRELICNDEGVPFFEARIDEEMEAVVGNLDRFQPNALLGGYYLAGLDDKVFNQDVDRPIPSLFVQVTGFKCGGIALYVSFSHQVTDGKGFFDFMCAWSEIAMRGELSFVPVHDRSSVTTMGELLGAPESISYEESRQAHPQNDNGASRKDVTHLEEHLPIVNNEYPSEPKVDPGAALRVKDVVKLENVLLHVKKEAVTNLKRQAVEENSNPNEYVSALDSIVSHLWRSLSSVDMEKLAGSALGVGNQDFVISHEVEGRARFYDMPLPPEYTGNCLFPLMIPRVSPTELQNQNHLFAARAIRTSVRDIDMSTIAWKAACMKTMQAMANWQNRDFRHHLVTSWVRFPMYQVEFKHGLGTPKFVGMNFNAKLFGEGATVVLPPLPGSDAIATLQFFAPKNIFNALLADHEFLSFFHPIALN